MADDFGKKLAAIEQSGKSRFGEKDWDAAMAAIRKAAPNGIGEAEMRQVAAQADPAQLLFALGKHALIDQASNFDRESEDAYSAIRQAERRKHNERKGRIF
jgi:hypothetical protein